MAGINKVIIVGNLGNNPELRTMPNGNAVANISVATSDVWTDKNSNERREITEWHRIVFFGRTAEVAGEYLRKGSKVYVEGKLRTRKWTDQNGVERYTTEIHGDTLQMLDSRGQGGNAGNQWQEDSASQPAPSIAKPATASKASSTAPSTTPSTEFVDQPIDDDIPF